MPMNLRLLSPCPRPLRHTLAAGLALGLLAWAPAQAAELLKLSPAQAEAAHLRTQVAQTASTANTGANLVLQGTVMLPSQATDLVSAPVGGVVQAVLVSPGQSVRAGTPVARLLSLNWSNGSATGCRPTPRPSWRVSACNATSNCLPRASSPSNACAKPVARPAWPR